MGNRRGIDMVAVGVQEIKLLTCSCCGSGFYGLQDVSADEGFGYCSKCGGDPEAKSFKKRIGWGLATFYEARFDIVRERLNEENRKKWDVLRYSRKCAFISNQVENGKMI